MMKARSKQGIRASGHCGLQLEGIGGVRGIWANESVSIR